MLRGARRLMSGIQPTAERAAELVANYDKVLSSVESAGPNVRLVAVSKLKPSSDIMALYNHGVRHFGENYVQELQAKAKELPKDIKWHFIGSLQTGKCKDLAKVDLLYAVETIDALKKAKKLLNACTSAINVFLQINTSSEEQKAGYSLGDLLELHETIEFLQGDTPLRLAGIMTIGSISQSTSGGENDDFAKLVTLKKGLDEKYGTNLELSMGMSNDYVTAIKQGATSVRVGSSIFGARPPRNGH